jgi:GH24 family phage-related lysozyme (muramidase)
VSEDLIERIRRHEGCKLLPYLDTTGHWTIGIGHCITECQAQSYANGISEQDAEYLLYADIGKARTEVLAEWPWAADLPPFRQDVLTELAFWIGAGGLYKFKNFLFHLRSGDIRGAANALLDSLLHEQIPGRTEELAELLLNGTTQPQQETTA